MFFKIFFNSPAEIIDDAQYNQCGRAEDPQYVVLRHHRLVAHIL